MKAIESEFQQAKQSDGNRVAQVLSHLMESDHPYARFGWGDARSLEVRPRELGLHMEAELRAFHERFYSANLLTMVLLGAESLDTLQAQCSGG